MVQMHHTYYESSDFQTRIVFEIIILPFCRMLSQSSDLWKNVVQTAKQHNQLGTKLTLRCENHPHTKTEVVKASVSDVQIRLVTFIVSNDTEK
jgi:hypothetical protein